MEGAERRGRVQEGTPFGWEAPADADGGVCTSTPVGVPRQLEHARGVARVHPTRLGALPN